jgi:hypothetical protein
MSKFQVGQKVRVIADTFKHDPHNLPIGSEYVIERINPATKFEEFPPFIQFMAALSGRAGVDIPERLHVKTGEGEEDYANLVVEDVELVNKINGKKIRMLEDDFGDGYQKGDVFEVFWSELDKQYFFTDRDGDIRPLEAHVHEVIA